MLYKCKEHFLLAFLLVYRSCKLIFLGCIVFFTLRVYLYSLRSWQSLHGLVWGREDQQTLAMKDCKHLDLCSAHTPFEQGGVFIVPHLLSHGTSVSVVSSNEPHLSVPSYVLQAYTNQSIQGTPLPGKGYNFWSVIEQWGFCSVPYLLWHGISISVVISEVVCRDRAPYPIPSYARQAFSEKDQ